MAAVKTKSAAVMAIVITILILIVINLLSLNIFARWDLTENKIYSISEPSKKIVAALNDRLTVKVFFSEDLPSPHNTDRRYLQDILEDFKAYSGGHLVYEFIDPLKEEHQAEAASYRLQPVRFDIVGSTKAEQILGYKAIVMLYGGRSETMPFLLNMDNFEYDFVRLIRKLTAPRNTRLGFSSGHGEPDFNSELRTANRILQEDFELMPVNLSNLSEVPEDLEALFIIGPTQKFMPQELYLIDQYLMRGGKVAFMLNSFDIDQNAGTAKPIETGLDSLLAYYGVSTRKDYVIDRSCYRYTNLRPVQGGYIPETVEVPFFINVLNFNKENPVTRFQKGLALVGASSLDTNHTLAAGLRREVLFSSSEYSGTVTGDLRMTLATVGDSSYNRRYLPLGVVIAGRFESFFKNKPIPDFTSPDTMMALQPPPRLTEGEETRIFVIGNGSFFDDNSAQDRMGRFEQNFVFFRNLVDWLAQDEDLIAIRAKGNLYNPFTKVLSDKNRATVTVVNIIALPVMVIIAGVLRWWTRRAARRRLSL